MSVAPGEQVDMPVELLADQLADTYDYELNVTTNDPLNEKRQDSRYAEHHR